MESPFLTIATMAFYFSVSNLCFRGNAVDSPNCVLLHTESDYEIRLYREVSWLSALVQGTSFQKSTHYGFHRIYQYLHGTNLNSSQFAMTASVLTNIRPSTTGVVYYIRLFQSKGNLPQPNPELNLQFTKWKAKCRASRKFSGFTDDDNVKTEMEALVASLNHNSTGSTAVIDYKTPFAIAQYNSCRHLSGRLNEVWIDVSGSNKDGCLPHQRR